jgi:alpha-mannosidase
MRRLFLSLPLLPFLLRGADTPDLKHNPTLYVVGYAHLDTEWNWDYVTTIGQYLPHTMLDNFELFEKYPHYIFNFTGANRYRMMKEYYPADYARVKKYVDSGRWYPAGSSMEEGDVNAPSAEAILRQILYGNKWFQREFGKSSAEYMLPDCFGFPASLPSILAHAGIKGFSTQKLSANWQPAPHVGGPDSPEKTPLGIPFNVGLWIGPDGKSVIAALNPLSYGSQVTYDLSKTPPPVNPNAGGRGGRGGGPSEDWPKRIQIDGDLTGIFADYHYVGTGDVGGSPQPDSVRVMEDILTKKLDAPPQPRFGGRGAQQQTPAPAGPPIQYGDGPLKIEWSNADQLFKDMIACCSLDRLPTYKGDLELINHSAGSLTSQTIHKRWNRENELLADAAEKASVAASWLGARAYPQQRLNDAWTLVMGGHFHDIMAGTATPKAYEYSWNDDVIAMNQFAEVLSDATEAVSGALNTQTKGVPVVVYNPLAIAREDVVEAEVSFPGGMPKAVRVTGPDGKEVASQISNGKVIFVANAPSAGYSVYDVQAAEAAMEAMFWRPEVMSAHLYDTLENDRYRVTTSEGDIVTIFDKSLNRELLSSPMYLGFQFEKPQQWPAWNMDWEDQKKAPREHVKGRPTARYVENGAARIAFEITRETEGSKFVQTIRLSAGDAGNRVEILNSIDWKIGETALKATFPLTASNPEATYNWDLGTIKRGNNDERKFEVASHQWIDLTDKSGQFGTTILTDDKNGSDKPDDNTLRLTLIYSPGVRNQYTYQASNDWGHHEFIYGIAGHAGTQPADWQAERLNQPLIAFQATKHAGSLGKTFSLVSVNNPRIRILALKKAESTDELILRAVEMDGNPAQNVRFTFAGQIAAAREVNGQEEPLGNATVTNGALVTDFTAFQPRTFAIKLAASSTKLSAPTWQPVALKYDVATATTDGTKSSSNFSLPAEMLPESIPYDGIQFKLASGANAVVPAGQSISLPGKFTRVYILAASTDGDQSATFKVGDRSQTLNIQDWGGYIGQWDNRTWKEKTVELPPFPGAANQQPRTRVEPFGELTGITPGFIKRADVAWFASHHHNADGSNALYSYSYLFAYAIDVHAGATTLTLPRNDKIRILAVTVADVAASAHPAQPLYDTLRR